MILVEAVVVEMLDLNRHPHDRRRWRPAMAEAADLGHRSLQVRGRCRDYHAAKMLGVA